MTDKQTDGWTHRREGGNSDLYKRFLRSFAGYALTNKPKSTRKYLLDGWFVKDRFEYLFSKVDFSNSELNNKGEPFEKVKNLFQISKCI